MKYLSLFLISFFSYFLLALTTYSIIISFLEKSKTLKDPFEEHEK